MKYYYVKLEVGGSKIIDLTTHIFFNTVTKYFHSNNITYPQTLKAT